MPGEENGGNGAGLQVNSRPWTRWALSVLLLSLATAVFSVAGALAWRDQDSAQVYTIPVVPSVSLPLLTNPLVIFVGRFPILTLLAIF